MTACIYCTNNLGILERDLIGLCEDNYIMQDVIKDYFKELIE